VLYSDYISPARLKLNLPEVAPELKRVWHPCSRWSTSVNLTTSRLVFLFTHSTTPLCWVIAAILVVAIPLLWFCCSVIAILSDKFFSFSKSNYLRTMYFPVFTCRSLCFDLFSLVLNLLAFSAFALPFSIFHPKALITDFRTADASSYPKSNFYWKTIAVRFNYRHFCGDHLLEHRYVQVRLRIIAKRWKQSPVTWFLESLQKTYSF